MRLKTSDLGQKAVKISDDLISHNHLLSVYELVLAKTGRNSGMA